MCGELLSIELIGRGVQTERHIPIEVVSDLNLEIGSLTGIISIQFGFFSKVCRSVVGSVLLLLLLCLDVLCCLWAVARTDGEVEGFGGDFIGSAETTIVLISHHG